MRTQVEAPGVEPRDVSGGISVAGVEKAFGAVKALDGVSLRAAPREVVAVAGPSGCGKSTLLELVCGLAQPDAGTVEAAPAALMPQRDGLLPWLSALDNAALALRVAGVSKAQARRAAHEHFAAFGLEGFERARPSELSGGMRQRVAFLRTLLAGQAGAVPRRAVRRARRAHPHADAALARRGARRASRAPCCWSRTTSRRPSCWPTGSCCSRRAPAA